MEGRSSLARVATLALVGYKFSQPSRDNGTRATPPNSFTRRVALRTTIAELPYYTIAAPPNSFPPQVRILGYAGRVLAVLVAVGWKTFDNQLCLPHLDTPLSFLKDFSDCNIGSVAGYHLIYAGRYG